MKEEKRPEWVPIEQSEAFASTIMDGTKPPFPENPPIKKRNISVEELVQGVKCNDRAFLAQAITLIESNAQKHKDKAQQLLKLLLPDTGKSIRIGITGVPGAGKSTFIEAFGTMLCEQGYKVAVLAIDPSSTLTRGSILGDKTRMERLIQQKNAFVRPSPSGGALGGVNRRTRETMLLCEAAGYNVIIVETVGVGQSEGMVRDMVDFFLLLTLTGAGDELQGIKRGILELTDAILINKADGENKVQALQTASLYTRMAHVFQPITDGWTVNISTCSALLGEGITEFWQTVRMFEAETKSSGVFEQRRLQQQKKWLYTSIREELEQRFFSHPEMRAHIFACERDILQGKKTVTTAVAELLTYYEAL
jgi:LAO/AO transport system kinase